MVKLTMKPTNIAGASEFEFEAENSITVGDLKQLLSPQLGDLAPQSIRLVCAGRVWLDEATLESYGVKDGSIVHCLNNPQAAPAIASTQALAPANPLAQMGGMAMPPAAAGEGNSLQQMMAQSQQMMQQNPEMMQQMMQSPMVQSMLENPEMMRMMMQMNPQTRQLMEENPEVARILQDPETLRQSARMMANPSLMREMQRQQDVSMGRLDAMPGGHQALARMHREVLDPLQNAMSGQGGDANSGVNTYAEDAQGHRNTAPLANPWGPPQPASQPAATATPAPTAPASGGYAQAPAPVNPMAQQMPTQPFGMMNNPMMQNPDMMNNMMQQMMQNPQMMQQAMQMSQQMFGGQQGGGAHPMAAMMNNPGMQQYLQRVMQNPQMMQEAMQIGQQLQQGGTPAVAPTAVAPTAVAPTQEGGAGGDGANVATQPTQPITPPVNPFAQMMQQMMQNPQAMQGMFGQPGNFGQNPMFGNFNPPAQPAQMDEAALAAAAANPVVRARFATQLEGLIAMGFSDEQKCLQALVQCDGNVDRALDRLFADN